MGIIIKRKIIGSIIPGPCPEEIMITENHYKVKATEKENDGIW
jgi:hypothetical protein